MRPAVAAALSALLPDRSGAEVERLLAATATLPLVAGGVDGVWPHPLWSTARGAALDRHDRSRALVAAAGERVASGDVVAGGALALASGDEEAIAGVLAAALGTQPPLVPLPVLRTWGEALRSDPPADPDGILAGYRAWLAGVLAAAASERSSAAGELLEGARAAFAASGDVEAELGVLLHQGTLARRRDDLAALGGLLERARALAAGGNRSATALVALGAALVAQFAGDHRGAVSLLEAPALSELRGDWAAQVRMVRGTNLALAGDVSAGLLELDAATGGGSGWQRAVAHDLLSAIRAAAGDLDGAWEDADHAVRLAEAHGSPALVDLGRASRACLWALAGDPRAAPELHRLRARGPKATEAAALVGVGTALLHAAAGDLAAARATLADLGPPASRLTRSTRWRVALEGAIDPDGGLAWGAAEEGTVGLAAAVAAGRAAAAHLAGGPPVDRQFRSLVPVAWCEPGAGPPALFLLGRAEVHRDHRRLDHPAWARARVRELALRLAVDGGGGRARVAADLWPDLAEEAAARNLRVTLTHLLDVLDPDRHRGGRSAVLEDRPGRLGLAAEVRVDVRDLKRHAAAIEWAASDGDRGAALAAARRLLACGSGDLLGGDPVGEWVEPVRRDVAETVLRAVDRAGHLALAASEPDLAEALGERGMVTDPWSEGARGLVVAARLARGDVDGARRAGLALLATLDSLGVRPSPATVELLHRSGLRAPLRPT